MRINKFLAIVLMALSSVFLPVGSALAEVTTTAGGTVNPGGQTLSISLTIAGQMETFDVPANEALGSALATYFSEVREAIQQVLAAIDASERGAVTTASRNVWTAFGLVNIMSTGIGSGGGGGCDNSVASCN